MCKERLFHISENPKIEIFIPRVSPSHFDDIGSDVVFAISEKLLHNYLFPRDCPRIAFYATNKTSQEDKERLMGPTTATYVVAVENRWMTAIQKTTLFVYEMPAPYFSLLDECAGYYISRRTVAPLSIKPVYNILEELLKREIELRMMPSLQNLAVQIGRSTLNYSVIRMRNAR
jgi:hypothetical protein